jgi:hypothetical protein
MPVSAKLVRVPEERLFVTGLVLTLGFGYVTEIWDTAWSLYDGAPLRLAVDIDDYASLTAGAAAAVVFHLMVVVHSRFRRATLERVMS